MLNNVKTVGLMALMTILLMVFGGILGGKVGVIFALVMAAVMNLGSYWFSDKIIMRMYKGNEVTSGELYDVVQELCNRNQLVMPKVFVIPESTPNAFATGRNPQHAVVAATQGIMSILSRDELMGVMAHELSHVKHRDILIGSIAATIAGAISYMATMAQWAMIFGGLGGDDEEGGSNIFVMIITMICAPIAAMLVQMAVSRSREYAADRGGAAMCGNPYFLASALRKLESANHQRPMHNVNDATAHMFIVSPLSGKGFQSMFSTHPPMDERVRRLNEMA
ncbi:MAG: zinc metalloprotease HtpX [Thermodesulfobacteriota bacterium]|nr:zinc metalloprotease HtpX [Thermodesulfobacteriota bacterium]